MVVGCIIQARMGSTRLPGKVLMNLDAKNPVLFYVINQIQNCKLIDEMVIATTTLGEDDKIDEYAKKMGITCFRGSTKDVLDRYYQCAKKFSFSKIVRITADCPLIDPTLVDQVVGKFKSEICDYATNFIPRTFPQGTDTEVFSFTALEKAWKNAKKPSEREHVTPFIYNNKDKFRISTIIYSKNISNLKWTIDRLEDLKLVKAIISKIHKRPILMNDILKLISKEPDLININKNYIMNEGYLNSLNEDDLFKSKNSDGY